MHRLDGGNGMVKQPGNGMAATIAIALVIFSAFIRIEVFASLESSAIFIIFYPAVIISALYGGILSGALATALSAAIADYFWMEPIGSLIVSHLADELALAVFVINGLFVSWVVDRLQRTNARLRQAEISRVSELERQVSEHVNHEEGFGLLAEALPQLVWITRADGWNIYFNKKWVEYTGLTLEESSGHGWNKPFHPDDKQRAWDAWQAAVNHNAPYSLECRLRRSDGSYRWWLVRGVPQVNATGTIERWFGTCTDIHDLTWRKQVEEGGAANERIYCAIGDSIDYGIWVSTPDGKNVYASPSFLNLIGLTQNECSDFGWGNALHPDEREKTITTWKECVRSEGKWEIEHLFRGVDDQWHPILVRGIPVRNSDGTIVFWAGINLDISNIRRAEDALIRANRMIHARSLTNFALIKATDELSYLKTACQIIVDVSGHTMMWISYSDHGPEKRVLPVAAFGVDDGYLESVNITWGNNERGRGPTGTAIRTGQPTICGDMDNDARVAPWRSAAIKRGFRSSLALPLITGSDKLGALTIYASVPNAFPDGEVKLLADIAHDIAFGVTFLRLRESKTRVAHSLREAKTKLSLFIEHAPAALAMLDNDMRYLFVSRRWLTDFQLEHSNIVGKSHYEVFPEVPERWKDIHRRCLAGAIEKCEEDAFVRADGRTDWVRWEIHPWQTDEGTIGGIVIMSEYITRQVESRHLIEKSRRLAEEANDAKTRFLASVSHDLRQPLQAQRFLLFNVARYAEKPDHIKACAQMEKTLEATELMLSRLMDYASLESGNVPVRREVFRLDQLVWDIVHQNDDESAAKGLAIGARMLPCWTDSDPILLGRIVRNLIANALRYTERGGILVGIRRRCGKLRLEIYDTGKGIPPDQQLVIFEEFRQLDNPERNRTKGYGLGLAIVAKTAELLDHQMFVRSVVGRGSVFAIEVPEVSGSDYSQTPRIPELLHAGDAISILVIEDDKVQADALNAIFTGYGYSVVVAYDADTAVMAAQTRTPDLIVSDYRLPGNNTGVDTVVSIRQRHNRSIPAIIVTGDTQAKITIEAASACCDILIKPFTPAALMASIARTLRLDDHVTVDGRDPQSIPPLG